MCGISGILRLSNKNPDIIKLVQSMNNSLKHKGPDDSGVR